MKFRFIFLLVFVLATFSLGYAAEGESDPLPEGFPSSVESLEPDLLPEQQEPIPGVPGAGEDTASSMIKDCLVTIIARLDNLLAYTELFTYILLPFSFAFFICWQLAKWFHSTFVKR